MVETVLQTNWSQLGFDLVRRMLLFHVHGCVPAQEPLDGVQALPRLDKYARRPLRMLLLHVHGCVLAQEPLDGVRTLPGLDGYIRRPRLMTAVVRIHGIY